jgi:hypothetical protein
MQVPEVQYCGILVGHERGRTARIRIFKSKGTMWSKGLYVSYTEVGSTHQVSMAAGEAERRASGKRSAARMVGKTVRKLIAHPKGRSPGVKR